MTAASQESLHFPDITIGMGLWAGERIRIIRTNLKLQMKLVCVELEVMYGLVTPHSATSLLKL